MSYIVRIYFDNEIYSIDLAKCFTSGNKVTVGSSSSDTQQINAFGLAPAHIKIIKTKKGYAIKGRRLYSGNKSLFFSDIISEGKQYTLRCEPELNLCIHPKQNEESVYVSLDGKEEISLGRADSNDIVLKNMRTSSKHCRIYKHGSKYRIKDIDSKNGTYINGHRIYDEELKDKDIINISIYSIIYENNALEILNTLNDIVLNIDPGVRSGDATLFFDSKSAGEKGTMRFF